MNEEKKEKRERENREGEGGRGKLKEGGGIGILYY